MSVYQSILDTYKNVGMNMVWVMKDDTEIKIKDMEDRHIQNCINMLKNKEKTHRRTAWIDVFEDVKIKRRKIKLIKIVSKI